MDGSRHVTLLARTCIVSRRRQRRYTSSNTGRVSCFCLGLLSLCMEENWERASAWLWQNSRIQMVKKGTKTSEFDVPNREEQVGGFLWPFCVPCVWQLSLFLIGLIDCSTDNARPVSGESSVPHLVSSGMLPTSGRSSEQQPAVSCVSNQWNVSCHCLGDPLNVPPPTNRFEVVAYVPSAPREQLETWE